MAFVTVDDLRLYYESRGTGHPVVVVPGLGADCRLFETLAAELARFHRVIVFDPRGSGRSDKPQGPYSIDQMAADLRDLIVALHLGVPDIVGYSMGGRTALAFAASHPQDVRRLVLVATSARVAPPRAFSARWFALNIVARIPTPSRLDPQPRSAFESQRRFVRIRRTRASEQDRGSHADRAREERSNDAEGARRRVAPDTRQPTCPPGRWPYELADPAQPGPGGDGLLLPRAGSIMTSRSNGAG